MRNPILFAGLLFILNACSSSAPAKAHPVIDDVDFPRTATSTNGQYELQGTIAYHDDDEPVTGVKLTIVPTGQVLSLAIAGAHKAQVPILVQLAGARGDIDYDVSVVSSSGLESPALRETVTLE